jgi:hypothetical protein
MGQPKAQGQRSIQIDGLRVPWAVRIAPNCRRPARTCFSELETSKGGSDIIDCLPRAHRAALSLELLGISHTQTDLESRSAALYVIEGTAGPRRDEEESPEARQRGYRQVDTGSRWLPKEMVPAGFLGASGGVGTTRSPT